MAIALITGASTGLGREFARILAASGYDLIVTARNQTQLEALAAEIYRDTARRVQRIASDLSRPESPGEIFAACHESLAEIDILINNAGVGMRGFFVELDTAEQMRMLQLNVNALTELCRLFGPVMADRGRGRILNVASTAAFQPGPLMAVYFATKAYVVSFSEALHNELRDRGVTVTTLCPGATRTEFQRRAKMDTSRLFERGGVMGAREVARIGIDAMMAGKSLVVAGRLNAAMAFLTRFAPRQFAASMARRFAAD